MLIVKRLIRKITFFLENSKVFCPKTYFEHSSLTVKGLRMVIICRFFIQSEQGHFIIPNEKLKVIFALKPLKDAEFFLTE